MSNTHPYPCSILIFKYDGTQQHTHHHLFTTYLLLYNIIVYLITIIIYTILTTTYIHTHSNII